MHAELTELARNRACADIVLVTGDGDLLPGLMSAKEHGVAVHLWAVQAADGDYNQSEDLVAEADERRVLDRAWITRAVRLSEPPAASPHPEPRSEIAAILAAPPPEPAPARPAVHPAPSRNGTTPPRPPAACAAPAGRDSAPGGHKTVPTPKDLATLGSRPPQPEPEPTATLRWSSDRGWVDRGVPEESPEAAALPMLSELTSPEQRWADREEDITAVSGDPFEVGQVFARRWAERLTTPAHLAQLAGQYPRIPHRIDGELLRYAARFGLLSHKDDQLDERDRYAIRAGFWREVDARTGTERAS